MANVYLRSSIVVVAFVLAFLLGYAMSAKTGIEPGYFGAVETGAYGTTDQAGQIEGLSEEAADYYESLLD